MRTPSPPTLMLAAAALAAPLLTAATAEAYRGAKPYYQWDYETRGPKRGYEGWVAPGYYCSYKRYPNRECRAGADGRERCRIVSWRLEQTCQ